MLRELYFPGRLKRTVLAVRYHLITLGIALVFVVPLLWVVAASLRQPGLPPSPTIEWLPQAPAWSNYTRIFEVVPLGGYLKNSLWVTLLAVPITITTASWAGFAMAQLPAPVRHWLILLTILLRMVPLTALWLTRFLLFKHLLLIDTYWALIAPAWMGSSPFFILLFYWTFRRTPVELFEAARLEGMSLLGIWAKIAMPLARPTVVTVGVLTFVQYWSDFINPLLYLKSEQHYTLTVGLQVLKQLDTTNWPLLLAGSVVMMVPILLIFFLVQHAFWPEGRLTGSYGR